MIKRSAVQMAIAPYRPGLWALQAYGLAADAAVDGFKGRVFRQESKGESIWDDHQSIYLNPLHGDSGRQIQGYGLYHNARGYHVDWEW